MLTLDTNVLVHDHEFDWRIELEKDTKIVRVHLRTVTASLLKLVVYWLHLVLGHVVEYVKALFLILVQTAI